MPKTALMDIVRHCDRILRTDKINDYSGAMNGLQVENHGTVTRIAAAVDATLSTIKLAIALRADLLIVHHGLFWNTRQPWTGKTYEMLRLLLGSNLAVYSSHLPLDLHPKLGNNVQLCAALGLRNPRPFFYSKEQHIGVEVRTKLPLEDLKRRLQAAVGGEPVVIPGGPSLCRRIGIVTGGAGDELKRAADEGVDTFITGGTLDYAWTTPALRLFASEVYDDTDEGLPTALHLGTAPLPAGTVSAASDHHPLVIEVGVRK